LVPNDVRIRLRVAKAYDKYSPTTIDVTNPEGSVNNWNPIYTFSTRSAATVTGSTATLSLGSAVAAGISATFTYTDSAGDQTAAVLQDSVGNDVASFSASATRAAAPSGLSGMAYHWKSHTLLSGVTVSVAGDGKAPGATSPLEIRGLSFDANGDARFDVYANAGTGIENFGFDLRVGGTAAVTWTETSFASWTFVTEAAAGQLTVAGFGTSALTGEVKLGSVLVDLAAGSDEVRVDVLFAALALLPVLGLHHIVSSHVRTESGDVYVCEDGGNMEVCVIADRGDGITEVSAFLRITGQSSSEWCGVAFSPDHAHMYISSNRGTDGRGRT
jgi:hypothetical protein